MALRFGATALVVLILLVSAGCARFPSTGAINTAPERTIYSEITVRGQIRSDYYYFFALDTDQRTETGPVPVVTGYGYTNGWGTIAGLSPDEPNREPPFYIQYHNGRFEQVVNGISRGLPYRYGISDDGKTLWVEFDQSLLDAVIPANTTNPFVDANWITMETIDEPLSGAIKEYDGFGRTGTSFLSDIPLNISQIWESGVNGLTDEPPYGPEENTTSLADIDMIHWIIEVKLRQASTTQ